jgi:putative nucleotidyltransferase with HDIG domain
MSLFGAARPRAPRLLVKVLGFSFGVTAAVLAAVFLVLSWQTRERLTRAIVGNQEASQRRFAELAAQRQREQRLVASALAENPTLKAAIDTYHAESAHHGTSPELVNTIKGELGKLQRTLSAPAMSVTDVDGRVLATVGPFAADWRTGTRLPERGDDAPDTPIETVIGRGTRVYLATIVPLMLGDDRVGDVYLAAPLDGSYARDLAREAGSAVAIVVDGHIVASSEPLSHLPDLERALPQAAGSVTLGDEELVVGRLWTVGAATVYAIDSVTSAARAAIHEAFGVLVVIAAGALLLAAFGSWWLARTLAAPIRDLTDTLAQMARERDFERPLVPTGGSRELDDLVATFEALRDAVAAAEDESEAAYVGVIGSLAAALDARDPYTAGHSERVANLSVAIARQLQLPDIDVETVRLGALLHDIGKIGVSDAVLRKPGRLSDDEFAQIKLHPTLGARILRPLRFLSAHLPVVELHHEQPNGRGYPHGLYGAQIPLLASIVHVADAFDAMTSARAYRPSRPADEAIEELQRHAGSMFAPDVVEMLAALPAHVLQSSQDAAAAATLADDGASVRGALIQFRARAAATARGRQAG